MSARHPEDRLRAGNHSRPEIAVGMSSCGIAAGARAVFDILGKEIRDRGLEWKLVSTGCNGACHAEPLVEARLPNGARYLYGNVDAEKAKKIVESHLAGGAAVQELLIPPDYPYLAKQKKTILRNCGVIDPESIDQYIERDGYAALRKVLSSMGPEAVIGEVKASGLRGRGGAGFSAGQKWSFARASKATGDPPRKFLICNGDEGDPGAFMNRSLLEGDPHAVLEGMLIAAYAIGASEGYIYVRAEYPLAITRLKTALEQMKEKGLLGDKILGADFSFDLHLKEGAGAFVCGEETALMGSIEGKRGMPTLRPPYPAVRGLWGAPTNINNVETYANVPAVIRMGASEYARIGTPNSKGTKIFALAGKISRGGMIEVPMGMSLREIIFGIGGGIQGGRSLKAVQMGGPSGGCIPESLADVLIDYDSLTATGAIMGSGGMVVMDDTTCMVDVARYFLGFTQSESCGKCTFCRIGTKRMLEILTRITEGKGRETDVAELEELAFKVKASSLCGLGQTAPNPVLTTLRYFRSEYDEHIKNRRCPAKKCKALIRFEVIPDKCTGCTLCAKVCPTKAARGERKKVHDIDQGACIRCGLCVDACGFDAIEVLTGGEGAGGLPAARARKPGGVDDR
jgi:NADH-quinone oxidoreductase subunit F